MRTVYRSVVRTSAEHWAWLRRMPRHGRCALNPDGGLAPVPLRDVTGIGFGCVGDDARALAAGDDTSRPGFGGGGAILTAVLALGDWDEYAAR